MLIQPKVQQFPFPSFPFPFPLSLPFPEPLNHLNPMKMPGNISGQYQPHHQLFHLGTVLSLVEDGDVLGF